jgi:hypothetical protein
MKRKKGLAKEGKNIAEKLRKKAVTLAKFIARKLAGEKCEYCGRTKKEGWQMHGSHIYPEGVYRSMSALVDNILCLCATHHTGGFWKNATEPSWHEDPIHFARWFNEKYPERAERLRLRSKEHIQADRYYWEEVLGELKQMEKNLGITQEMGV